MSKTSSVVRGGCFCSNIRYEIDSAASVRKVVNCHCTMCRRTSGAPFVTWLVLPKTSFHFTTAQPAHLKSSNEGDRYFCKDCGTPISCVVSHNEKYVDVTLGSLDQPEDFEPDGDFHEDNRLKWIKT